jgi:23S rRNA (cytidine1920-2'-O)/16S rRNA (cytidine1409-2'-O)-methyltransferase
MRVDQLLVEKKLVGTRSQAKSLIDLGKVYLKDKLITKAGQIIPENEVQDLRIEGQTPVGRGAFKLAAALDFFLVNPQGQVWVDIGASTGGFTEVLLERGAQKVYAIDVGHNQLHKKLKIDPRVVNLEGQHILNFDSSLLGGSLNGCVIDLSFISLTKVAPSIRAWLPSRSLVLALIKPQFEVGSERLPKDGVLKSEELRQLALKKVLDSFHDEGFTSQGVMDSPIEGKAGNREFFACFQLL